jgi:hypothetical protein
MGVHRCPRRRLPRGKRIGHDWVDTTLEKALQRISSLCLRTLLLLKMLLLYEVLLHQLLLLDLLLLLQLRLLLQALLLDPLLHLLLQLMLM